MHESPPRALAIPAGLLTLAVPALFASSTVAWTFDFDPALGDPLWRFLYHPAAVVGWAHDWGLDTPYRTRFLRGVLLAFMPMFLPVFVFRLVALQAPARSRRDVDANLGSPKRLLHARGFGASGSGIILGRTGRKFVRDTGDGHVIVLGASRSGKGRGVVVPTLLDYPESMIVNDPKAELAAITGGRRRELGHVAIFEPTSRYSDGLNPLAVLRNDDSLIGASQDMARMLINPAAALRGDRYWDESGVYLVSGLLTHIVARGRPSLAKLHRLLTDVASDTYPSPAHPLADDVLRTHAALHEKTRSIVNSNVLTTLQFLADPLIRRCTEETTFDAGDLVCGRYPLTVFLTTPPAQVARLQPLSRLIFQSLTFELMHRPDRMRDGRLKTRPVLALLDEAASLGRLAFVEYNMRECAGYGIRVVLVVQDPEQLENLYGPREAITGFCSTVAMIPGLSRGAIENARRYAGEALVLRSATSKKRGGLSVPNVTQSEAMEAILNPADMLARAPTHILVFAPLSGCRPTYLEKVRYDADPVLAPLAAHGDA